MTHQLGAGTSACAIPSSALPPARDKLVLWLDPSDYNTLTTGVADIVTELHDKSASQNHASGESTREPTLVTTGKNNRSVLSFDATSSQVMKLDSEINLVGKSVFWVSRRRGSNTRHVILGHSSSIHYMCYFGTPTVMFVDGINNLGAPHIGTPIGWDDVMDDFALYDYQISASTAQGYCNGHAGDKKSHSNTSFPIDQLGRLQAHTSGSANLLTGDIAEILIYDTSDLGTETIQAIRRYLSEKWLADQFNIDAGGTEDFTTITAALADGRLNYRKNATPQITHLAAGTYAETELALHSGMQLQGADRATTTLNGAQANSASSAQIANTSPIEMFLPSSIKNLRIEGENIRYGVYMRAEKPEEVGVDSYIVDSCDIRHLGNPSPNDTWSSTTAIGCGSENGTRHFVRNSRLQSNFACYAMRDTAGTTYTKGADILIEDCELVMPSPAAGKLQHALRLSSIGSGIYNHTARINNVTDGMALALDQENTFEITDPAELYATQNSYTVTIRDSQLLVLANLAPYTRPFRTQALRLVDATANRAAPTVGGDVADILFNSSFGNAESEAGGGGLSARITGTYNISENGVGSAGTVLDHTLGARLGDCSSINKTLVLGLDGGASEVTITFDQNFTAQSNADVLSFMNTALAGTATASAVNVDDDVWRYVTDETYETIVTNTTHTG